jgi:hypothetical protein
MGFFRRNLVGDDPEEAQSRMLTEPRAANLDTLGKSCTQWGQENNSKEEIDAIKSAILEVAKESGIASHFLLTFMVQESKGCVRAPTTNYGVNNPGLMQSFNGRSSCNPDGNGVVPCPPETIKGMISEGAGIGLEFGLGQAIEQSGASDVSKYYKAARIYNSGSIAASGNLGDGIATHCYSSDIANRLLGWASDAGSECDEATIGSMGGSAPSSTPSGGDSEGTQQTESEPEADAPATDGPTQAPAATGDSNPSGPKAEGAAPNCSKWYSVKKGDTCASTGIAFAKLAELNSSLKTDCSNLMAGSAYCVAA